MEPSISKENTPEHKKARVRAWLYKWLSMLEMQDIEEAKFSESRNIETIEIKFKS